MPRDEKAQEGPAPGPGAVCDFQDRFQFPLELAQYSARDWVKIFISPMVYSLIVPLALLDAWMWLYQTVCFGLFGIAKVRRGDHLDFDRGRLPYLNALERFNCDYCAYANGILAFAREIAARTEQYFCPIKHARRRLGAHARYDRFYEPGDEKGYREDSARLRDELSGSIPRSGDRRGRTRGSEPGTRRAGPGR